MSLVDFIKTNNNLNSQKELTFFGGSFNPWHKGHTSCLELMPKSNCIIVIPDHNPFKELTPSKEKLSPLSEIEKELEIRKENTFIFDGFFHDDKSNPTVNWISEVKEAYPEKSLSLLMGFDTFMGLDKWIESERLLRNLDTIFIASRLDQEELKQKQKDLLSKLAPHLKINFLGRHDFEELSSKSLRKS